MASEREIIWESEREKIMLSFLPINFLLSMRTGPKVRRKKERKKERLMS